MAAKIPIRIYLSEEKIPKSWYNPQKTGKKKVILFGLSRTGYFDMTAFMAYNDKTMNDYIPTDEDIAKNLSALPDISQNR